jgi:Straboviridae/Kyanoviridae head completion nuclease
VVSKLPKGAFAVVFPAARSCAHELKLLVVLISLYLSDVNIGVENPSEIRTKEVPLAKPYKYHGTRRGFYKPKNPEKYEGNVDNIFYRSGIELRFMRKLDEEPRILKWSSEEVIVPYIKPTDGKLHRYYVDFKATLRRHDDSVKTYLIECKWSTALLPPKVPKRKTKRYFAECYNYKVNQAKWRAAEKVCEKNGWDWLILTEKHLTF